MKKRIIIIAALLSLLMSFDALAYKEGFTYKDPYYNMAYSCRVDFYGMQFKIIGNAPIAKVADTDINDLKPVSFSIVEIEETDDDGNPTGVKNKRIRGTMETSEGETRKYYVTNSWYHNPDDGKWYCTDNDGNVITNTFTPDGYTVDASGVWIKDGVQVVEKCSNPEGKKLSLHEPGGVEIHKVVDAALDIVSFNEVKAADLKGIYLYPYTDIFGGSYYVIYIRTGGTTRYGIGMDLYDLDAKKNVGGFDDLLYYKYTGSKYSEEDKDKLNQINCQISQKVIDTVLAHERGEYIGPAIFVLPDLDDASEEELQAIKQALEERKQTKGKNRSVSEENEESSNDKESGYIYITNWTLSTK